MTDDGQAQNSLHANSSNCAGQMGWGGGGGVRETGVLTSLFFSAVNDDIHKSLDEFKFGQI